MNPNDFRPMTAADFIGPAADLAVVLETIARRSSASGAPVRLFLSGDPGIGKSALLDLFVARLGADRWSVTKLNGTQINVERLDEFARTLCYKELGGGFRVLRIEEVDKASAAAQVRMLTILDDLPERVAIVAT